MKEIYSTFGIYRITNKVTGKSYIGQTKASFGDRWDSHKASLNAGKHYNIELQDDWIKLGTDAFEFAVVQAVKDATVLDELEINVIADYRQNGHCYNIYDGGQAHCGTGRSLSPDTKRKIGEKNRKNMLGRKASEETRMKMSNAQKKRFDNMSDEERKEYGKAIAQYASGYRWSEESRKAFSQKQREHPNSAKLTPDDVREIRARKAAGATLSEIAVEYHTSPAYISSIVRRKRWADI